MNLKKAKYIIFVFCLLMVVSIVVCSITKIKWIGYLGIAFALLGVADTIAVLLSLIDFVSFITQKIFY